VRNIVSRPDGRRIHVARMLGQLFVCADACCCGRVQDGYAPVPRDLYHAEWERRGLRNRVHLTIGGCLGPCALANVVMLLFDGRQAWFHSIATDAQVVALYDWIEGLVRAEEWSPAPPALAAYQFTASTWEERPDGKPVDDLHLRQGAPQPKACRVPPPAALLPAALHDNAASDRLVANMDGPAAVPRKNGELVFEEPWEGRVFGMAVALHDHRLYGWEEFQRQLIAQIAQAEARGEDSRYYERWLASFERLLADKGLVTPEELEDRTESFEFGERDEVY
jgi:nitrile hydratase accessory protein